MTLTAPVLTAANLADEYGVTLVSDPHPNPQERDRNMGEGMNHYRVTLCRPDRDAAGEYVDRRMTVDYSMGEGLHGLPTLDRIIACLAGDVSGISVYLPGDWEGWAIDLGFDLDDSDEACMALEAFDATRDNSAAFLAWLPEGVTLERLGY